MVLICVSTWFLAMSIACLYETVVGVGPESGRRLATEIVDSILSFYRFLAVVPSTVGSCLCVVRKVLHS